MRSLIASVGIALLFASTGCARLSAYSQSELAFQQDVETCTRYGAQYQSPAYEECMEVQRQRHAVATARQTDLIAESNDIIAGGR